MARSNHNKTEKRPEKIILWRRHHLRLDVVVRKEKPPCCRADKVVDVVVVVLIFNRAVMEKNDSILPLAIAREEEINPQYHETWHEETITLRTRYTRKTY